MMIIEMYKFFLFYKPKGRRGYKTFGGSQIKSMYYHLALVTIGTKGGYFASKDIPASRLYGTLSKSGAIVFYSNVSVR